MAAVSSVTSYGNADVQALDIRVLSRPADIRGGERRIGGTSVISLSGGPAEVDLQAREHERGLIDFIFLEEGVFSYRGADNWVPLAAQLIVVPNELLRRVRFGDRWRLTLARLPREAMEGFIPELPAKIGTFDRRTTLENGMHAFVSTLMRCGDSASSIEGYAMEQLLLEMGGAVLLDRMGGGWNRGTPQAVLRDRAMAVIVQQCADRELTPKRVAFETQTSLRQLQAVFAAAGTTVAAEIRRQRARTAQLLLTDARYDVLSVDQIAEQSGFGTTMSMRRALSEIYKAGPREIRRDRHDVLSHSPAE